MKKFKQDPTLPQGFSHTFRKRFWSKIAKTDSCWLWVGGSNNGYGMISPGKDGVNNVLAHRISWMLHNGPIPDGMDILHNCPSGDNSLCVNPAHLRPGTHAENMADKVKKGRQYRPNPDTIRGENNNASKFTTGDIVVMRQLRSMGYTLYKIAGFFGVGHGTTGKICRRERWTHI
jgi:hypothetical protein